MPEGAPFRRYRAEVRAEWLDYNGHMHDASYAEVLSDANELLFDDLDLGEVYRAASGKAYYTVETHIRFLAECTQGQTLTASTLLVSADAKRIHLHTEVSNDEGLAATGESFYVHVDPSIGRAAELDEPRLGSLLALRDEHEALPRPDHLGRGVAERRTRSSS